MTIEFKDLGDIESFYQGFKEPEIDYDPCEEDVIVRCADCKKPIDDCICI